MVETTRAREAIERARETIERAREGARALVDALARDDDAMMRSNDDDSIDDDDARRRAMERIVRRCAADARFVDAAVRAVRRETSTIGKAETREAGTGGDAVAAAARDANARGAVTCSIERASDEEGGEEFVCVSVRGAFAVRWRRDDPGDASTTTATAEEGRDTAAHAAMTERLLEVARGAVDEGLGKDGASVRMVEWLETMHDVFSAPDVAAGGRVLAADASRGGALIPSRLLPGRAWAN